MLHPALRRFSRAATALAILSTVLVAGMAMRSANPTATSSEESAVAPHDQWIIALKGKHRQLFDAPNPDGGIPLIHALNYYNTYNDAFKVSDREINSVVTFYGKTVFHGLDDSMWAKYRISEFVGEKDAAGRPYAVNPWRTNPVILGQAIPAASIESLQKRGGAFIICNNALGILSGLLAKSQGLDPNAVYADMKAHILPGVTLVPAMVIAIEQAQNAGITYHRQ